MVKGVNKSVIEITDTGNKYFSKVMLFVAPEYVNKNSKKLTQQAEDVIRKLRLNNEAESLRKAVKMVRKRRLALMLSGIMGSIILIALVILILFL